ncbi:conserved Plasmodium protein, unknown function [Plasmodium ovale]|uniref:Uncharacterized protein n=1 Tax=Plasmodium ovale TaxID=36330 RepID=A0A1D3TKX7_PLAOA|nr:conserved Plasmodium protein, unknown function [Plasmodium ovale]
MNVILLLLFCLFTLKRLAISEKINDVPLINYEMVPSQRWKVSTKELAKLKEKLKIFITSEIQKEGSALLRKYFKEFLLSEDQEDDTKTVESSPEKGSEGKLTESAEIGNEDKGKRSFGVNGPILLI